MRMLIEGHSDPVSAKRLGVSPRTYAGYVADLKEDFEAETRFQLGYTLGRLRHLRHREDPRPTEPRRLKYTKAATRGHCPRVWIEPGLGVALGPNKVGGELGPRLNRVVVCVSVAERNQPSSACAGAAMPTRPKLSVAVMTAMATLRAMFMEFPLHLCHRVPRKTR